MQTEAKSIVDAVAVGGGVASLAGWLPDIAALLTIVWLSIRIWESETVKGLLGRKGESDGDP